MLVISIFFHERNMFSESNFLLKKKCVLRAFHRCCDSRFELDKPNRQTNMFQSEDHCSKTLLCASKQWHTGAKEVHYCCRWIFVLLILGSDWILNFTSYTFRLNNFNINQSHAFYWISSIMERRLFFFATHSKTKMLLLSFVFFFLFVFLFCCS